MRFSEDKDILLVSDLVRLVEEDRTRCTLLSSGKGTVINLHLRKVSKIVKPSKGGISILEAGVTP